MRKLTPEQFKSKYGDEALKSFGEQETKPGYFSRVGQSLKETAVGLGQDLQTQAETIATGELEDDPLKMAGGALRGGLRTAGAVAKAGLTPIMEAPGIKEGTEFVGEKLADTLPVKKYVDWASRHPEAAKDIENTLDVSAFLGVGKGAQATLKAGKAAIPKVQAGVKSSVQTAKQLGQQGVEKIKAPPPTPKEAVGQVLQGQTRDIPTGLKAFKNVDTSGVKNYSQLLNKVDDSIKDLSTKVDDVLDDVKPVKLGDLKVVTKTTAGKPITIDYVSRSLQHLKEVYKKIGDDVAVKNTDDLIKKARTVGLTRREVNNLARQYGIEFGEKAFGKTGEALTSVNAKLYETTRKGIKVVARQGIGGKAAQAMDESISSLYRVKDLIKKNVEAVNKLNQKIQSRGLLEKVGYQATKYLDLATGGSIRGIMEGLLPRGVGYKVMNALDLEQVLQRNLKIIQKALNTTSSPN